MPISEYALIKLVVAMSDSHYSALGLLEEIKFRLRNLSVEAIDTFEQAGVDIEQSVKTMMGKPEIPFKVNKKKEDEKERTRYIG